MPVSCIEAAGTLVGFAYAARRLGRGGDPFRLAALGVLVGIAAFSIIVLSSPLGSPTLFRVGTVLIGLGGGLFSVGTLTAAMGLASEGEAGLALGAWGAVQATAAGAAIAFGGGVRDLVGSLAATGALGPALTDATVGYAVVYHLEIALLFATLVAIGPLVRTATDPRSKSRFGLAEFPG
jgi:BCD family chlorophyll transporter-like MFS transporter